MVFLCDTSAQEFDKREIARIEVPSYIVDNLKYGVRPYQGEKPKE